LERALMLAGELGGIEGKPRVVEYRSAPSLLEAWLLSQSSSRGEVALLDWLNAQYAIPQMRYIAP
jgi:hypothetical protein